MPDPLELLPGEAVGPFHLGSLLFNVLNHVRSFRSDYPSARTAWDEDSPSSSPIHLSLTSPPLHLTFSPLSQRLSRIEVQGLDPASTVSYRGECLGAPGEEDDVVKTLRRVLGPTYGSSTVTSAQNGAGGAAEEMLSYPGVAFGVTKAQGGSTLHRIIVTPLPAPAGVWVEQAWLHAELPESPAIAHGDLRLAEIHLDSKKRPERVLLHFHPLSSDDPASPPAIPPVELRIGHTTSEDILCELGAAVRTFWKEDDRLSIHTSSLSRSSPSSALDPNPYFLSYPHLGLTLLVSSAPSSSFSDSAHTLEKILIHSNLPGEVQFGRTARAPWTLVLSDAERVGCEAGFERVRGALSGGAVGAGTCVAGRARPAARGGGKRVEQPLEDLVVGSSSSSPNGGGGGGSPASARSGGGGAGGAERERPMILDRTADGRDGVRGKTTEIHGFPGIALEVTQSGDIETVWLF
ncbi:uncharacterized protein JCM10292_001705 [Rhodotorula paludigena]|uniref:uncharacterized protein n=1 Tax=Rhodotorula paludigena TaxID=86838 RepID=UPI00318018CB